MSKTPSFDKLRAGSSRTKRENGGAPAAFLEKRGGAALPGFAFFPGNFFYVVDVRSHLGDEVMQVVALSLIHI